MSTQLISYDLNAPGQKYDDLIEEIKGLGAWWHHLDSTWLVKSDLTASDIRDRLAKCLDIEDELLVVNVTGDLRAWRGFNDRGSRWLKETWD